MTRLQSRPQAQNGSQRHDKGRSRAEIKRMIADVLRREFPTDTVDVSNGYKDFIHVLVVSRRFDKMSEKEKQDFMWGIIKSSGLKKSEVTRISLMATVSPADITY